jgi:hypothetical protein
MNDKGNSKKEMLERFEKLGIPVPLKPIAPSANSKNPDLASKMDLIRNGGLKNEYSSFIEKAEKVTAAPSYIPVPKVGKKPGEVSKDTPSLESFSKNSNSEAALYENMLFGEVDSNTRSTQSAKDVTDFGPSNLDTRAKLQERLKERQNQAIENASTQNFIGGIQLTEAELTEKITEIAKEISKNMIKTVLTEFSKKEGGIIVESKNVKKAEIVGKNKVKIGNTIYEVKKVPQ